MCFAKDGDSPKSPVLEGITARAETAVQPPRSPWAKLLRTKQVVKPKLARKIASSAKINLNKYWSKFGELMAPQYNEYKNLNAVTKPVKEDLLTLPFSQYFYPIDPVKPTGQDSVDLDHRFESIDVDAEINDNLANEVREICYTTQNESCFLCKLCYD